LLHHVTLAMRPEWIDACLAFYRLLGFREVTPPPALQRRAHWLERAGTQIHLMPVKEPPPRWQGHLAVVVADYDQTVEVLTQAGQEVEGRRPHWDSPRCVVRDPAGNRVEIMAFAPPGAERP